MLDEHVRPIAFTDLGAARTKLRNGDLDVLYVSGREVLIEQARRGPATTRRASPARSPSWPARRRAPRSIAPARSRVRGLKPAPTSLPTRLTGLAVVVLIYLLVRTGARVRIREALRGESSA